MFAALEMVCDAVAHLGREIAFHVVGEFSPNVVAVDFYDLVWRRHRSSDHPMPQPGKGDKAVRTRESVAILGIALVAPVEHAVARSRRLVVRGSLPAVRRSFETFPALPNPTAT